MNRSARHMAAAVAVVVGCAGAIDALAQQAGQQASAQSKAAATADQKARPKAQAAKKDEAGKKLEPSAAQAAVEDGVNSLAQGRTDAAVASLTSALSAASLPQGQTARALYYRGVAYRRQSKPALAISDLTNALWVKGGLTEEQRADALQQRSAAFREAGLPDQGDPGSAGRTNAKAGSAKAPFSAVAPAPPAGSSTQVSGGGGLSFFANLFGGGSSAPSEPAPSGAAAVAPATTASVTPRAPVSSAAPSVTQSPSQMGSPQSLAANSDKPATRMVPVLNTGSSLPMGFQDMGGPTREVEVSTLGRASLPTSSSSPLPPATAAQPAAASAPGNGKPAAAAAKQAASTAPAPKSASPVQTASATQAAVSGGGVVPSTAATSALPRGALRIQVAAVRSPEEARNVASKLQAQYARELAGRAPSVDQVSAGNFGNFYRVQVGPFVSARETEDLCTKLKSGGLDCRLVSQ